MPGGDDDTAGEAVPPGEVLRGTALDDRLRDPKTPVLPRRALSVRRSPKITRS